MHIAVMLTIMVPSWEFANTRCECGHKGIDHPERKCEVCDCKTYKPRN